LLPAAASCELCCFLAFAFGSGWDAAGEHKRIACFLWIGGLAPSDADPQRILTLQSFFGNLWRCVLLLYCCGFAGSRDGLCFFSGIGGGSNMRLVPGRACLVGAARPPWNKLPQVSVHLAVMCFVGGGGSVGLLRLESEAPRRDSDGVELGLFFFFDSSLFFPFLLLLVVRVQVAGQEKACGKTASKGPTADGRLRRMCCSFPLFAPSFRTDGGGLRLVCAVWRTDGGRWPGRRWKIYSSSRDLVVIFLFLGVLSAKVGCTDPFASF